MQAKRIRMRRPYRRPSLARSILALAALDLLAVLGAAHSQEPPEITHGVAVGDVTSDSAVVWARSDREALLAVSYQREDGGAGRQESTSTSPASEATDFTVQVELEGLLPATRYPFEVAFVDFRGQRSASQRGSFRTAPADNAAAAVSFLVSGDLGGQSYCRDRERGYPIFAPMTALAADFFVANGDLIYADDACPEQGPEGRSNVPGDFPGIAAAAVDWQDPVQVLEVYRAHWRYNRSDPAFQAFLQTTPIYAQWDDHEVINDFGGPWSSHPSWPGRAGYPNLVDAGRRALFEFHPLRREPGEAGRIYRSFRWGRNLELFLLDGRSYRSRNDLPDDPLSPKTLLGRSQLVWLGEALASSDALFKVVSSNVPLSIPTGGRAQLYGRDAWANGQVEDFSTRTGFENELLELLRALDRTNVRNLVFVTTDVHFAAQLRYDLDLDGDGDRLLFHELVNGPLSAYRTPAPPALDATLRPVVLYAEGDLLNFAYIRIGEVSGEVGGEASAEVGAGRVHLWADVRDELGRVRPGSELEIVPEP